MPRAGLAGEDIVCLAHEAWHGPWKTYQQIMSLVARSNRVLYVGPPVSLRSALDGLRRRTARLPILERVTDKLTVYHEPRPLARASDGRWWGRSFNRGSGLVRLRHVRWLAQRDGMRTPILWIFDPSFLRAVGALNEKLVVYQVLDNYVEFFPTGARAARTEMARREAALLTYADVVFTVSEGLYRRCVRANPNTFLVPNGVDYDRFQATIAGSETLPEMDGIPRPILGYVGVLQADLDLSLLETMAEKRPGWSQVFVGPDELGDKRARFRALTARPNVRYLGNRQPSEVPRYINACDVCLMPVDVSHSSVADSDSIKVYEYLACGKPVVATNIPSVRRFIPVVRVATSHEEFLRRVEDSLAQDARTQASRKALAKENSWQRRVEVMEKFIQSRVSAHASEGRRAAAGRRNTASGRS